MILTVKCRDELNAYWAQVVAVPNATDFSKHHHSEHLRAFLDVDGILAAVRFFKIKILVSSTKAFRR